MLTTSAYFDQRMWLQGGVGCLAAGLVAHFWERNGAAGPASATVAAEQADWLARKLHDPSTPTNTPGALR